MSQLIPFQFDEKPVRVHLDDEGNAWWEAQDICLILGIHSVSDAVARLKPGEKRPGETHNRLIINEKGLYRLIMRSNKPDAERFQDWVFGEVLPTIRKTGRYDVVPSESFPALQNLVIQVVQALPAMAQAMQAITVGVQSLSSQLHTHSTQLAHIAHRVEQVEAALDNRPGFMTILGFARLHHLRISLSEARKYGQELRKRAKRALVTIGEVPDERFGKVNTYPVELLDELFAPLLETRRVIDGLGETLGH